LRRVRRAQANDVGAAVDTKQNELVATTFVNINWPTFVPWSAAGGGVIAFLAGHGPFGARTPTESPAFRACERK
jgi:hypothetical protein